jgi:hypothetical protein
MPLQQNLTNALIIQDEAPQGQEQEPGQENNNNEL